MVQGATRCAAWTDAQTGGVASELDAADGDALGGGASVIGLEDVDAGPFTALRLAAM